MDIPGFTVLKQIGAGGFATVYLAEQVSLKRQVALKVLKPCDNDAGEWVSRFMREAQIIARLDHPAIVDIYDFGQSASGELYYAMPYLSYGDLKQLQWSCDTELVESLTVICDGLAHAHEQGVIHRDLKPENILLNRLGKPLIADFGIAYAETGDTRLTQEGQTIGSINYMSPEQILGQAVDARSDVYSLGAVIFEVLTGEVPFKRDNIMATGMAHLHEQPPPLPENQNQWQELIHRCMSKLPKDRYQDANALKQALLAMDQPGKVTLPLPASAQQARPRQTKWRWLAAAVLAGLALGATWMMTGEPDQPLVDGRPKTVQSEPPISNDAPASQAPADQSARPIDEEPESTANVTAKKLSPAKQPPPTEIQISATTRKQKGDKIVELSWSGVNGRNVVVNRKRNGRDARSFSSGNDGRYQDRFNKGGRYTYQVCDESGSNCSSEVTVSF